MKKLHFEIQVQAEPAVVYHAIIDSVHFKKWTAVFSPTSRFVGNWQKGSTIKFLSTAEDGSIVGMFSRIIDNIPYKFISLEHLNYIQNGELINEGKDAEELKGALENYTLIKKGDATILKIDSDSFGDYEAYFKETWPKALEVIKNICENR